MSRQAAQIRKQAQDIQRNAKKLAAETIPRNIERALTGVGIVVGNKALEYTPIEFSMLVNSQYRAVDAYPNRYSVRVGYTADYAAALHEREDWSPRPVEDKKGPAWNPNAKPKFLTDAAEETRIEYTRIMLGDLKL